jgi:hypothetical protein
MATEFGLTAVRGVHVGDDVANLVGVLGQGDGAYFNQAKLGATVNEAGVNELVGTVYHLSVCGGGNVGTDSGDLTVFYQQVTLDGAFGDGFDGSVF